MFQNNKFDTPLYALLTLCALKLDKYNEIITMLICGLGFFFIFNTIVQYMFQWNTKHIEALH